MAVIVLGILGMHALPSHAGMAGMAGMGSDGHAMSSMDQGVSDPGALTAVEVSAPAPSVPQMLMLCGFMLLGLGLALLACIARRVGAALHRLGPPMLSARIQLWRRATGPPSAWSFSVIRC